MSGWVPISKELVVSLPRDRAYTDLEAVYSLAVDYDEGHSVTVAGYAALWSWSRGKVERFLDKAGVAISYPAATSGTQNQRGQIVIQISSRKQADNRQIKFIDFNQLHAESSRKQAGAGQKTSRKQVATIDTKPDTKKTLSEFFGKLWEKYPANGQVKRKEAERHYYASVKNESDMERINLALGNYLTHLETETWKKPQNGSTWFNNWQDWSTADEQ